MSRRNSIDIRAERVTVQSVAETSSWDDCAYSHLVVRIHKPSEEDLVRLIAEAASYLDWLRRRRALDEGAKAKLTEVMTKG